MPYNRSDVQTKICSTCKKSLPLEDFVRSRNQKDGFGSRCRPCHNAKVKEWKKSNPEKVRLMTARDTAKEAARPYGKNVRRVGCTPEQAEALHEAQSGVCAICGRTQPSGKRLAVDHDHKTGKIRGLLCDPCNLALGSFRDDVHLLKRAIAYLRRHRADV